MVHVHVGTISVAFVLMTWIGTALQLCVLVEASPQMVNSVPIFYLDEYFDETQHRGHVRNGSDTVRAMASTPDSISTNTICSWLEQNNGACEHRYTKAFVGCSFVTTEDNLFTMLEAFGSVSINRIEALLTIQLIVDSTWTSVDATSEENDAEIGFNGTFGGPTENLVNIQDTDTAMQAPYLPDTTPYLGAYYLWHLDRIDQETLPLDNLYHHQSKKLGAQAEIYVLDTGIRCTHLGIVGRCEHGAIYNSDAYGAPLPGSSGTCEELGNADCAPDLHGHGSHVSGLAAGTFTGIAKKAKVIAVRVMNQYGSGYFSDVVRGLEYVLERKQASPGTPMVVFMSLGGPFESEAMKIAINSLEAANILSVVAAGNSDVNACTFTPAAIPVAITTGGVDKTDRRAKYGRVGSNYGDCIDIFAPGKSIVSLSRYGDNRYTIKSGTSMATPMVAGTLAIIAAAFPDLSTSQLTNALLQGATYEALNTSNLASPNVFLSVINTYNVANTIATQIGETGESSASVLPSASPFMSPSMSPSVSQSTTLAPITSEPTSASPTVSPSMSPSVSQSTTLAPITSEPTSAFPTMVPTTSEPTFTSPTNAPTMCSTSFSRIGTAAMLMFPDLDLLTVMDVNRSDCEFVCLQSDACKSFTHTQRGGHEVSETSVSITLFQEATSSECRLYTRRFEWYEMEESEGETMYYDKVECIDRCPDGEYTNYEKMKNRRPKRLKKFSWEYTVSWSGKCRRECDRTANCVAFTYIPHTRRKQGGLCRLYEFSYEYAQTRTHNLWDYYVRRPCRSTCPDEALGRFNVVEGQRVDTGGGANVASADTLVFSSASNSKNNIEQCAQACVNYGSVRCKSFTFVVDPDSNGYGRCRLFPKIYGDAALRSSNNNNYYVMSLDACE